MQKKGNLIEVGLEPRSSEPISQTHYYLLFCFSTLYNSTHKILTFLGHEIIRFCVHNIHVIACIASGCEIKIRNAEIKK